MSLILLSALGDPFTARDLAGRVLPGATLDFFLAGTSEPADVGDDDGHFEADAAGLFEEIDLEADVSYRVVHKTAEGVLLYDVDPYVCTCGVDDRVFRSPIQRALDSDGRIAPGARLLSYDAGDLSPLPLYADPDLERPLSNPIVANAAGIFVSPIYGDDDVEYQLELQDADGNTLQEFDPYECACGATAAPISFDVTVGHFEELLYGYDAAELVGSVEPTPLEVDGITVLVIHSFPSIFSIYSQVGPITDVGYTTLVAQGDSGEIEIPLQVPDDGPHDLGGGVFVASWFVEVWQSEAVRQITFSSEP